VNARMGFTSLKYIKYCDQLVMLCFDINITEQAVQEVLRMNLGQDADYHEIFLFSAVPTGKCQDSISVR
jgi:hypothetical protein